MGLGIPETSMATVAPKYSKAEFAKRGEMMYKGRVLPAIDARRDDGKLILIDIETGDYEIDADEMAAAERLRARRPKAQVWMRRIGSKPTRRFGGRVGAKP
jgi:hypothetical protein